MLNAILETVLFLWLFALLAMFFLLGHCLSRRAARSHELLLRSWFIHLRWTNVALPAAVLTWIFILHHSNDPLRYVKWSETSYIFLASCQVLAPPLLALLAYQLGAIGLVRRAVEPGLRLRNLLAAWFWGTLSGPVPLLFLITGLVFAAFSYLRLAAVLSGCAALCYLVSQRAHWQSMGITFEPIGAGELRDRILAIARLASVKPTSLRLLRSSRRPLATAFAASGNSICISASLVENLPKPELDAIAAHELAHLRYKHNLLMLPALLAPPFVFIALFSAIPWPPLQRYAHFLALPPGICLAVAFSRYFERKADRLAASLIPEPAALIRALARVTALNLLPTQWSGWDAKLFSHPSVAERAAHIASTFHLPLGEVLPQLSPPPAAPEDLYPLPPPEPDSVLNLHVQRSELLRNLSVLASFALPPLALTWLHSSLSPLFLWTSAAAASLALNYLVETLRQVFDFRSLESSFRLRYHLSGGIFTAFAPSVDPRYFNGFAFWDVGVTSTEGGLLSFQGERLSFTISSTACSAAASPAVPRKARIGLLRADAFDFFLADRSFRLIALTSRHALPALIHAWSVAPPPSLTPHLPDFPQVESSTPSQVDSLSALFAGTVLIALVTAALTPLLAQGWTPFPALAAAAAGLADGLLRRFVSRPKPAARP